jgi:hypothetical protein
VSNRQPRLEVLIDFVSLNHKQHLASTMRVRDDSVDAID